MPPDPQPEQPSLPKPPTTSIRILKLPGHRLRFYAATLQSLHVPAPPPSRPTNLITVVSISDTHGTQPPIPPGDLLLHAGDLSVWGTFTEIQDQLIWLAAQPHKYKVVIAGNHDLLLDEGFMQRHPERWRQVLEAVGGGAKGEQPTIENSMRGLKDLEWGNVIYLQNESVELNFKGGRVLKIYGSPDTPEYGLSAFQYPRDEDVWSKRIPEDTDIVLAHGPPRGHLDGVKKSGCAFLAGEVARVIPRLVVFGHIHVGYGKVEIVFDGVGKAHEAILGQWGAWGALVRMALGVVWGRVVPRTLRSHEKETIYVNAAIVQGYEEHTVKNEAVVLQI